MAGLIGNEQPDTSLRSCISDSESIVSGLVSGNSGFGGNGLVMLDEDSQEHILLKHRFYSGIGSAAKHCTVVAACKVMHSTGSARTRFEAFQLYSESMTDKRDGNPNIKFAWYGTSKEGIDQIMHRGFDFCGTAEDSGLYGLGVCLSPENSAIDSIVSSTADAYGLRHVLLCRAILGNTEEVPLGSKQSRPSTEEFDSGVDNLKFPKKYIVWPTQLKTHILPMYVVSIRLDFQPKGLQMEPPRKPSSPWIPFTALISMISGCLPPSKVCFIKKFHNAYMERKITRQQLVFHVRQLSGDKLLIAALRSFQSKKMKAGTISKLKKCRGP